MSWYDPQFSEAVAAAGLRLYCNPLQWYVAKLARGDTFSLARYGDGELACMYGVQGKNTDGCDYTEQLGEDLRYSLTREDADFYYGMQRVLPEDVVKFRGVRPAEKPWVDSEIFGRSLLHGELYPLVRQLRNMRTVLVGNRHLNKVARMLGCASIINTPECNTYRVKDELIQALLPHQKPSVFLFSCGMTAKVLIAQLHGRFHKAWLLDCGHLWDVFCGRITREELKLITPEIIKRNLGESCC